MKISFASATLTSFLFFLGVLQVCHSQSVDPYQEARDKDSAMQNYRAVEQSRSATPDADAALGADVIVSLLRKEPALKLQIKRVLIQKALDQGRLLAEEDLGDNELFGLIRDEFTIRKIASDEIEKRHYLSLKPTDEEAFEARLAQRRIEQLEDSEIAHEQRKQREADGVGGESSQRPLVRAGAAPNAPSAPVQPSFKDSGPSSLSPDDGSLPRVSPSELPQLLTASAQLGGSGGSGAASRSAVTQSSLLAPTITSEPALPYERE